MFLMLLGGATAACGCWQLLTWWRLQSWPDVTATVKGARLQRHLMRWEINNPFHQKTYAPYVRYEYRVGGQTYSSKRIGVGMIGASFPQLARRVTARYSPHSETTAYHHPSKPQIAYLEKGFGTGIALNILAGLLFLALGLHIHLR